jgi:hypothetical protein
LYFTILKVIQYYKEIESCTRSKERDTFQDLKHLQIQQRTRNTLVTTDKMRRKEFYSGKKKKHIVKTQYMVNRKGKILHKSKFKKDSMTIQFTQIYIH